MEFIVFLKGILIGFIMAVPVGPIGIMCIRKTLAEGQLRGLIIGIGAATADMLYGSIAAFGLTIISNTLYNQRVWIRLVGGALFLFLGVRTFINHPKDINMPKNGGILRSYLTTVFLTLTNPLTIFSFIIIFAALSIANGLSYVSATALVAGIFIGSAYWFLFLSTGVTLFRKRLNLTGLIWVNRIAGVLIIISGVIAIVSVL